MANQNKRSASVDKATFVRVYNAEAKAGKTTQQIADILGMKKASVSARASALRTELAEKGFALPYAKGDERTRGSDEDFAAVLAGLDKVEPEAVESATDSE